MLTRIQCLLCILLVSFGASTTLGQASIADFQKTLTEKAGFRATDFNSLQLNQPVVRLAPASEKREIAVTGLVNINAGADEFLRLYRDSMLRKSNAAILEIGSFGLQPTLGDLQSLTLETEDIEDLKECIAGDCQVKLSAAMIDRFRKEIDWAAPDYQIKATDLFRQMLFEYIKDYRARGEAALIQYHDKRDQVSLAEEQRGLSSASSYINDFLANPNAGLQLLDEAIVWSKIKFGLKPVIAVNHISIYKRDNTIGPQVLIASKQLYANHYFNASLALTAFVSVPEVTNGGYLVYENRSRADGLEGPFAKLKRGAVEKKALESLRGILEHSKASLEGSAWTTTTTELSLYQSKSWGHRLFGGVRPLLWLVMVSALVALLALGRRRADNTTAPKSKALKPKSANS
jgi:hypothetical protein